MGSFLLRCTASLTGTRMLQLVGMSSLSSYPAVTPGYITASNPNPNPKLKLNLKHKPKNQNEVECTRRAISLASDSDSDCQEAVRNRLHYI